MPGYFSIDDPAAHKVIYGHGSSWAKGDWYDAWHVGPDMSNLFSERDSKKHAVMRRKVASMYTMTSLTSYEAYVDNCIGLLKNHFEDLASSNSVMDLGHWLQCYAFDVISMITVCSKKGFY
jgi:Cytochrome P450